MVHHFAVTPVEQHDTALAVVHAEPVNHIVESNIQLKLLFADDFR